MHSIAHCGDLLWALAQHHFTDTPEQERMMNVIAARVSAPVAHIYLYDEDERLVRSVMAILQRNLLSIDFLKQWLSQLIRPVERIAFNEEVERQLDIMGSKAETGARHNIKHFLRSLYFQLLSPGFASLTKVDEKPPQADEFLPLVEDALRNIRTWC